MASEAVASAEAFALLAASLRASDAPTTSPGYHYDMLHDTERNAAYAAAIEADAAPDDFVLDVGCGSGLLSLLASRTG